MKIKNSLALFLCVILVTLPNTFWGQTKLGLTSSKDLHQFLIDRWSTDNGLPYNNLSHIIQSKDGYIWISTFEGLIRFDGKNFEIFTQKDFPAFKTNGIYQVAEDIDGGLWLATQGSGLLKLKNDKVTNATPDFSDPISAVYSSRSGVVWMGTINSGVFSLIDGRREELRFEGLKGAPIRKLVSDHSGRIWIASEGHGLFVYDHGIVTRYTSANGLPNDRVVALALGEENEVWVGTTAGLCKWDGDQFLMVEGFEGKRITDIYEDDYQSLWVGTRSGCARVRQGNSKIEWITADDGLGGNAIAALTFDLEGSLWLCTRRAGLTRLRDGKFLNFTQELGLRSKNINHICEIDQDEYWVASDNGTIDILKDGVINSLTLPEKFENARIKHVFKDSKERIWIASYSGVLSLEGGESNYLTKEDGLASNRARKVFEDSKGNIWVGFRNGGLSMMNPEGEWEVLNAETGLSSEFVMCLGEDAEGNILVGTNGGGLNVINSNKEVSVFGSEQGLSATIIFNMYVDKQNRVWLATNAGIAKFEKGKFVMFRSSEGLPISTPFDVMEDREGYFWMPSSDGIIRLKKEELLENEKNRDKKVSFMLYDRGDGLISKECTPSAEVLISNNGRLWFPTLNGFSQIDPNSISINQLVPEVKIKSFMVDDQAVDIYQNIVLEPGKKRFIINFTALSFVSPPKMKFKYKLSSLDNDWVNVGEDRQAVFTNIPYGEHVFQVIASNNDGVWNKDGATLKFTLQPFFYQTPWAYLFGVLLFIGLGFLIYKARVRVIKRQNLMLEKQVMERTAEINTQKEEIASQRDQLSASFDRMKTVSEIGQEVTAVLNIEGLVQVVYKHVKKLMTVDGFGIGVYNEQEISLEFRGYIEKGEVLSNEFDKLSNKNLLSVYCYERQESVFIKDLEVDSRNQFSKMEFPNHGESPQSIIYLPLSLKGRKLGVITVQSFKKEAYNSDQISFLQTLANYIAIAIDNSRAYEIINDKNQDITDSLRYAQTIQHAILPSKEALEDVFAAHFLMFLPKDIVSGDFYWMSRKKETTYLAVVDCTGHGVPGAFMSMIGSELLNELVNTPKIKGPAAILSKLDQLIYRSLNQGESKNTDGMDVCLCKIVKDESGYEITFAGAKRPLFYTDQGELKELKGDRKHIGGIFQKIGVAKDFNDRVIRLKKGDRLYLTTDGYVDQASPNRKKIGTKKFRQLLEEKQELEMPRQGDFFTGYLAKHQKGINQRDDITILGVEL